MKRLMLLTMILSSLSVTGQRLKYSDVFDMIKAADDERGLMMVKDYLQVETDHPNANYLLQGFYQKRYKSADVLTDYEAAIANADQTQLRLLKCQAIINEKDVKRNSLYYSKDPSQPATWEDISSELKLEWDSAIFFLEKIPPIYSSFTKSVSFYDAAIKNYAAICGAFTSSDNLYMLYDEEVERDLLELKSNYDSTLYFFSKYKNLIEEYPISHNQELEIQPIERFRLQGLVVRVDFLQPKISIWDYGQWVDKVRSLVGGEIQTLRTQLKESYTSIQKALNEGNQSNTLDSKAKKQLIFNLEKYDFQSLPVALLNYNEFLAGLHEKRKNSLTFDTVSNVDRKYIFYSQMINDARKADTLLTIVKERNTEIKRLKHEEFLSSIFEGSDGLESFVSSQETSNSDLFNTYVTELRSAIIEDYTPPPDSGKLARFKRIDYPLYIRPVPAVPIEGQKYVLDWKPSQDGSRYFSGVTKSKEGNMVAFIFQENNGAIGWIREYDYAVDSVGNKGNNVPGGMELTKDGVAFVINTQNNESDAINRFVLVGEGGIEKLSLELTNISSFPKDINFDEDKNRFIAVFRGGNNIAEPAENLPTQIVALNGIGDILWSRSHVFSGSFVDLVALQNGVMIVSNYRSYTDQKGTKYQAPTNGSTNCALLRLDDSGEVISEKAITHSAGYHVQKVVKASENNINLMGYKRNPVSSAHSRLTESPDLVHIIVDSYTNVLTSNLN